MAGKKGSVLKKEPVKKSKVVDKVKKLAKKLDIPKHVQNMLRDATYGKALEFKQRTLDPSMKILYIDIETSPMISLTWGMFNQFISPVQVMHESSILCYAAKWEHSGEEIFDSVYKSTFKQMMTKLHDLLSETDVVVHFNGKKFDMKRINREFVRLGFEPTEKYTEVDILHIARGVGGFDSNKLEFISRALGVGAKIQNSGFPLWIGCMSGNAESWQEMEEYNVQDTALLQYLYHLYLPWIRIHPNVGVYQAAAGKTVDKPTCTNCGSTHVVRKGMAKTKTQMYQRYRCGACGTPLRGRKTILPKEDRPNILVQEV